MVEDINGKEKKKNLTIFFSILILQIYSLIKILKVDIKFIYYLFIYLFINLLIYILIYTFYKNNYKILFL